jgi:hypothetical protein
MTMDNGNARGKMMAGVMMQQGQVTEEPLSEAPTYPQGTGAARGDMMARLLTNSKMTPPAEKNPKVALFAGEGAKTANLEALGIAKQMQSDGHGRDAILDKTGWWHEHGRWNFEISPGEQLPTTKRPSDAALKQGVKLKDVYGSPELTDAYPTIADAPFKASPWTSSGAPSMAWVPLGRKGAFSGVHVNQKSLEDGGLASRYTMQHELQHDVDNYEGSNSIQPSAQSRSAPWEKRPAELRAENAAGRDMLMTPDERKQNPPWETEAFFMKHRDPGEMMMGTDVSYQRPK